MVLTSRPFRNHKIDIVFGAASGARTNLEVLDSLRRKKNTVLPSLNFSIFDRDRKRQLGTDHRLVGRPVIEKDPGLRLLRFPLQIENNVNV
jgi:hypothetical protein